MTKLRALWTVVALGLVLLTTAGPAAAYVVEALTWISADEALDKAALEKAIQAAVDDIAAHAVAFTPTLVSLRDAKLVGDRVYLFVLFADVTDAARAAYDATVGAYRQTVLSSFQGVEDNLAALRILEQENGVQDEAVNAAEKSVDLTTNQYKAGTVSYLNVITVQTIALTNAATAIQIRGRRMAAAVLLIQALGGGWTAADLPSP